MALRYVMYCQFYVWHDVFISESITMLCLEGVRQVAVSVGHQTTTVFSWVHCNAAPGVKSALYNCLVLVALSEWNPSRWHCCNSAVVCTRAQGFYEAAYDVIKSASERFPSSSRESVVWMCCEQRIRYTSALHRGRLNAAERAINNLASVNRLDADYW